MQEIKSIVFFANTLADVFYQMKTIKGLKIVCGCTSIDTLPEKSLSIRKIQELKFITKKERHIDFGPALPLSQILALDKSKLPEILYLAVESIANSAVRNIATIGGNICSTGIKHTLYAPFMALDAHLEFRNQNETQLERFNNFTTVPKGFLLSKITVPLEDWEISVFERLGPAHIITENSASFAFLVSTKKSVITNMRLAFAGKITFRSQALENHVIGMKLPLTDKIIELFVKEAADIFDDAAVNIEYNSILRQQFINLTKYSLEQLS